MRLVNRLVHRTDVDRETAVAAKDPAPHPGTGSPSARGRTLPLVLGVLVVVAAVVVGLLGWQAMSLRSSERDAAAALDSARTRTVQVFSYGPATVEADIQRAREQLSGLFASQFDRLAAVIVPASRKQGLSSKVEVRRAALIDSRPDRAEALLLLHQVLASSAQPRPQESMIEVKATMTKTPDGQWLISNLQPI